MKGLLIVIVLLYLLSLNSCGTKNKEKTVEEITDVTKQEVMFQNLLKIVSLTDSRSLVNDSLAFLILPLQASCPACRKKTIDSIVKHQKELNDGHFIVISANGGKKTMSAFFREQQYELPVNKQLYLDSTNAGWRYDLYKDNTVFYYAYNRKVYRKVTAVPATIKSDLKEFFSN